MVDCYSVPILFVPHYSQMYCLTGPYSVFIIIIVCLVVVLTPLVLPHCLQPQEQDKTDYWAFSQVRHAITFLQLYTMY